ncbi:amidase signature domain-containing protein [Aspergillus undulatus]|uniref:amidase signature domain-containing protein n=1 Tax=Aspergillus undulatus TaxID=1810928 RepID=UPI003CCD7C1A
MSLTALSSSAPEFAAITSPNTGNQFVGHFAAGTSNLNFTDNGASSIQDGPHLAQISENAADLAPVCRIHSDEYMAFINGLLPNGSSQDTTGVRVAVKDIIDLKGVKTSNGNRPWFELYDTVNANAPAMPRVIDLGVAMIGKTKTAQRPVRALQAAYDWVDVAIGTDTGGSIRIPAGKNGVYGLRPSFGALFSVIEEGQFFDAMGFHTCSPPYMFWRHMQMVGFNLVWRDQLRKVIELFRAAYAAAFGGRSPFINPFPEARYASAGSVTQEDVGVAYKRFTDFREWVRGEHCKA